jgi:glycosyltransferase involved in cell wall biosynthesis
MRIGVDATCWWNRRGFGRFTRLLLAAMLDAPRDHRFHLFVDREPAPEMLRPHVEIVRVETGRTVTEAAVADGRRRAVDLLAFRRAALSRPLDVIYFPAVYSWFPTGGRAPTVITFHDAIAEHHPELVFPNPMGRALWTAKSWLARRTAAGFTTVSNAARQEIADYLHIPPERVHVVLEAADPVFAPVADPARRAAVRARYGLAPEGRLLVYVGGLAPHKNLLRLVEAFAEAVGDPALADLQLVFVGDPHGDGFHSNHEAIQARAATEPNLSGRVVFTGFVPDEDLVALYSDAWMVAMPALSEGFGLPAAEAIACGTPVVATAGGAVAEVVGEAGLFFDPLDVADMAAAIGRAATDAALYGRLRAACAPRAAELSWSAAASATLDVLEGYGGGR